MVDVYAVSIATNFRVLMLRRAAGVRCTGAWEVVHGSMEPGERPEDAAVRELSEETALPLLALYSVGCNPFYVPRQGVVQVAVGFAAVVELVPPTLGEEHDAFDWLSLEDAIERATWPRTAKTIRDIHHLLRAGDAGPVEDALRVR